MGSEAPTLTLDLKLCAAKAAASLLQPAIAGQTLSSQLEELLRDLAVERAKIDAFKRELPKSSLIVDDVMKNLQDQLDQCRSERHHLTVQTVQSEKLGVEQELKSDKDKMNWMSSAQLWSDNYDESEHTPTITNINKSTKKKVDEEMCLGGGAFAPFKPPVRKEEKVPVELPNLGLLTSAINTSACSAPVVEAEIHYGGLECKMRTPVAAAAAASPMPSHLNLHSQQQQQLSRKARRCWSPELHRRFVLSLQQLGGPQVATPKQIRELMKVDGLTNDEVKSHLQKYRLHTRRAPPNSAQVNRPMGGGLWVHHYSASSQQSGNQSGSPQGPLQLAGSGVAVSVTAGDSCEEDGRSESYSWK